MVMPELPAQMWPNGPTWTRQLGSQPSRVMEQVGD